ncbi:MAG: hypothetical protein U5O39_08035 [Gammaproteobacteria bacterium]|nr:hypothetical protein [Gammaproteobacteria bacterium]
MSETEARSSLWQNPGFRSLPSVRRRLRASPFRCGTLLISWLLVGILLLPADSVGITQAIIGIPGVFLMLIGGATADRTDPRSLLMMVYSVAWLVPLALAGTVAAGWLNIWTVMLFGLGDERRYVLLEPGAAIDFEPGCRHRSPACGHLVDGHHVPDANHRPHAGRAEWRLPGSRSCSSFKVPACCWARSW